MIRSALFLLSLLCLFGIRAETAEPVGLQIIVVSSQADAQSVLDRLKQGENFGTLAREKSIDPTAASGGYIGAMDPSSLRSELRDALEGVTAGRLTSIVQISSGFAILKVLNKGDLPRGDANPTRTLPLAGQGNVRLSPDIGGFTQANVAMAVSMPRTPGFGQDLRQVCEVRRKAISTVLGKVEGLFADPEKAVYAHYTAAQLLAYQGKIDDAIHEWEAAYQLEGANGKMAQQLEEAIGVAYLYRASPNDPAPQRIDESHLFPAHPGALHPRVEDIEKAKEYLAKCLKREPANLEVKWLLDLCSVPTVKPSSEESIHFTDVAPAAGLNFLTTAGGVIADDFDNDGHIDIVTSQQDDCAPLQYFHNDGKGHFTKQPGLADQLGGLNIIQADYNNDGCVDVLVLRGGWEFPRRLSLLANSCHGTFTDVTAKSGLAEPARSTQSAVWTDIDNDGHLDLFVANENAPAELLLNKGDGTFTNISKAAGIDRVGFSKGVVAGDYDNDGYPDIYVSNLNGDNFLYHNNHDRTFTEVAATAGVQKPWASFAAWFFDYDNDGWQDLFVTSYYMSTEETARGYLGLPPNAETLKLYRNLGNGHFADVSVSVGLNRVFMPMGSNFGDIDNDGFLDIYLGNGNPSFASLVPNVLLHNKQGRSFVDITASSGTGAMAKGHGVAFADLNGDGYEDIFAVVGGAVPGDRHRARLFQNPGNGNRWIGLQLEGVTSNRSAMGARIDVNVDGKRHIYRTVGSGGSFGASPLRQHIGVGLAKQIQNIEIWWPASNTRQNLAHVATNQWLQVKEAPKTFPATGMVLKVDPSQRKITVSEDSIPNYMDAMVMSYQVRDAIPAGILPGVPVQFNLVVDRDSSYVTELHARKFDSVARDPVQVRTLKLMESAANQQTTELAIGQTVPDFALTDQNQQHVQLSDFKGKLVALTFIYTRCPLPDYCLRLNNNFGQLQRRFQQEIDSKLVLLSVSFDPVHDTPEVLAKYASIWKANPAGWHFLTGPLDDVKQICGRFGMNFWPDEGLLTHSLHTVLIDRQGKLAANIEGNQFTAEQFGDLIATRLSETP